MLKKTRTYGLSRVEAIDVMTGELLLFSVEHQALHVLSIRYPDGIQVPPCSETFTEVEATFLVDYEKLMKEAEESDVPHLKRYYL